MSQPPTSKGKENTGKKYASLNVNQTYKGTKVENRSAAGQTRHGMQSLGKVSQNRRLPPPANLPSLKKENLGNDPTVNLVPTGSSGWGKKEKNSTGKSEESKQTQQKQSKLEQAPAISLRPNAGVALKNPSEQAKGWSNLQTITGSAPPQPANSFQREFPRLGGDSGGQSSQESAKDPESDKRAQANDVTNIQSRQIGPNGPRMDFTHDQQRLVFNGAPAMQGPGSQFYPPFHPAGMVPPYMHMMQQMYPYPYPQNRMTPPSSVAQPPKAPTPKTEGSDRPATVKQEDIQSMDDDVDAGGWAGDQDEVDYTAKLKFDVSDDEQESSNDQPGDKARRDMKRNDNAGYNESRSTHSTAQPREINDSRSYEGRTEAWGDQPMGYQGQMQFRHPGWIRGPFPPQYDPSRGPPPQGYPYPAPWMYPVPGNYRMQGMPQQRTGESGSGQLGMPTVSGAPMNMHHSGSPKPPVSDRNDSKDFKKEKKSSHQDDQDEAERRANAAAKLQAVEARMKQREESEKTRRDSETSNRSGHRERLDSENSDSSRSTSQRDKYNKSRETPPRFLKQQSQAKSSKGAKNDVLVSVANEASACITAPESGSVPRIMKRRDSLRSEDASSVHSQDSWVNIVTSEKEASKEDFTDEPTPTGRLELEYSGDYGHSKKLSGDKVARTYETNSKPSKEVKQVWKNKAVTDENNTDKKQKASLHSNQAINDDIAGVNFRGDGSFPSNMEGKKEEKGKAGAKKDIKKYEYRQDKVKFKDYRVDGSHGKKEQDVDGRSRQKDDRKYGRESRKDKDDDKIGGRKNLDQEGKTYTKENYNSGNAEYRNSQDKENRPRFEGSSTRVQKAAENDKKSRIQDAKFEKEEFKSKGSKPKLKPVTDNFKKLEKPKNKNMTLKLSSGKPEIADRTNNQVEQGEETERKKLSAAWSQVVSGETIDDIVGQSDVKNESQPKKSLREIQAEEEQKESEMSKARESTEGAKDENEKRFINQDTNKTINEKKDDERVIRRNNRDRAGDRYYDVRENSIRKRSQYGRERRTNDRYEKYVVDRPSSRTKEQYENVNEKSGYSGRSDKVPDAKKSQRDDRKHNIEDRKRKHDATERNAEDNEKIDQNFSSCELEQDKPKAAENSDSYNDLQHGQTDQSRYSECGRGRRGGRVPLYSRGRGKTTYSNRPAKYKDNRYIPKELQTKDLATSPEDFKASTQGTSAETRGVKDERNYRKSDERFRDPKRRDKQGYYDYPGNRGFHSRGQSSRRGRGYSASGQSRGLVKDDPGNDSGLLEDASKLEKASDDRDCKDKPEESSEIEHAGSWNETDSDFENTDEYTDEEDEDDQETGDVSAHEGKAILESSRGFRAGGRGQSRGRAFEKSYGQRYTYDDKRFNSSYKTGKIPPRFQKQKEYSPDTRRGYGYRVHGTRSRGKSYQTYNSRGRGPGKPNSSKFSKQGTGSKNDGTKNELSGDSDDDTFHSAEDFLNSGDERHTTKDAKYNNEYDSSKRYSSRGKYPSFKGGSARGKGRAGRNGNSNHFLADRQQERVSHIDTSGWAVTLPAANQISTAGSKTAEEKFGGKLSRTVSMKRNDMNYSHTYDDRSLGTSEALSEFSEPPKKIAKSKVFEKIDILRHFDVNNIASVVCIDDMPQNTESVEALSQAEDDGFVQVTSRKAQKVLREKQKEEEKRKIQEEFNSKSAKKTNFDSKEVASKPGRTTKFADQHSQRATPACSQSSGQPTVQGMSQSQTSNAAMAAVGGWEPAQALLRGVQAVTSVDNLESNKPVSIPAPPPTINAWKRPLSFTSSLANTTTTNSNSAHPPLPDPKAVGTGKPNSSPAKQVPSVLASQSPDVIIPNGVPSNYNELVNADHENHNNVIESEPAGRKSSLTRKTEQRKINKGAKRETAPRFQNIGKGKMVSNATQSDADITLETRGMSSAAGDLNIIRSSTLQGEDRAPGRRPDASKLRRCNSESGKEEPVSGLPPAEHGEPPAISFIQDDSQSNSRFVENTVKEEIRALKDNTLKEPKIENGACSTEEENAKDTARSVIKSLADDDEKNLETRSLPSSSPPLVVEIHAPRNNGPSSDPGKANTVPVSKYLTQEVDEMSMKVLSARKIWDNMPASISENLPTSWNEEDKTNTTSTVVTPITSTSNEIDLKKDKEKIITAAPVAVVTAQNITVNEEDVRVAVAKIDNGFIAKKTVMEQQNNVCKVKPQQKQQLQQTTIDDKQLITTLTNSHLFQSQFPFQQSQSQFPFQKSFALPVHSSSSRSNLQQPYMLPLERQQMPESVASNVLYSQRETALRDLPIQQPQLPVNLQPVNQVRPTSPLSHQIQDSLQPSMMLNNIYGTPTIQSTQQNPVLWPVVSRHALQPATSLSYLSQHQSHERSSDNLNSSPLYMTFDQGSSSILSAQRFNSQVQQAPALGLVVPQQSLRSGSMLNVLQANQTSKENQIFSISPTPSPFHHIADLQIGASGHSDLTKHVNAKPFQPSSKTPPGGHSSQGLANQPSQLIQHQQAKFVSQINKLTGPSANLQQHLASQQTSEHSEPSQSEKHSVQQQQQVVQQHSFQQSQILAVQPHGVMSHSIQPHSSMSLQQHAPQQGTGQQQFISHHSFHNTHPTAVGQRSYQNKAVSSVSPSVQGQKRMGALSPVDASLQFIHAATSSASSSAQNHQHGSLMQHGNQTANIVQVLQPAQSLTAHSTRTRPFIVRPSVQTFPKYQRTVPGPIQRPPRPSAIISASSASRPKQPVLPIVKSVDVSQANANNGPLPNAVPAASSFRNEEHQKMIEETKKYFASQNKTESASNSLAVSSADVTANVAAQVILARSTEKEVKGELTPCKQDVIDIPAAAMLNDPTDIDSIIKSRPSLAKAFRGIISKQDKGPQLNTEKSIENRPQEKEEKPKKANGIRNSRPIIKDQKTGIAKPLPQKNIERNKRAHKPSQESNRGKQ